MNDTSHTCETCALYLGGTYAFCRDGHEDECADSAFECWEPAACDAIVVI